MAMASAASSPQPQQTASSANLTVLPPIVTDASTKRPGRQRSSSYARERLSTHSNVSLASHNRSRPGSHVFPIFHSSLSYALVRDFAYPPIHPLHYGPLPPRVSVASTPASEPRRLSDPPAPWDSSRGQWSMSPWSTDHSYGHQQLPAMSFGDGPPYSEDEDLHSPVFSTPHHRKNKSTGTDLNGRKGRKSSNRAHHGSVYYENDAERGMLVSMNADGSETYYVNDDDHDDMDDGPGGEYVTYPASESRYSRAGGYGNDPSYGHDGDFESEDDYGTHRYSRDFQFAVGCPDEEMHGKAVALFDFTREHENELPLTEGQVIFVSYRHGQGWLVAEDPRTGESGLVPEEFVRLLRDIEGGLTSLNGEPDPEDEEEVHQHAYFDPNSTTGSDQQTIPSATNEQSQQQQNRPEPTSASAANGEKGEEVASSSSLPSGSNSDSNMSHLNPPQKQGIDVPAEKNSHIQAC
ncbi:adaptor protein NBP2 [Aspergillus homomorphus CBS 101889]|uniref:SH3 domain-containing protein n=1 Tax=Aspergillus homomorphus (strain CBS 101889) TaxID=1450537 RepID=A0A395HUU1_ASPHC|nr:hypothetical protein BO97DRAFT_99992 [Aspergillus homomorphus CBS 101889]RAL11286.1 hypothetical protein BO97DRAFT_99992 [Aspergillus homomorphus CBS 101889]